VGVVLGVEEIEEALDLVAPHMGPVDGPRFVSISGVGVRGVGGDEGELVGGDFFAASVPDLDPAMAGEAIDEDGFGEGIGAVNGMAFGVREKSSCDGEYAGEQGILCGVLANRFG